MPGARKRKYPGTHLVELLQQFVEDPGIQLPLETDPGEGDPSDQRELQVGDVSLNGMLVEDGQGDVGQIPAPLPAPSLHRETILAALLVRSNYLRKPFNRSGEPPPQVPKLSGESFQDAGETPKSSAHLRSRLIIY